MNDAPPGAAALGAIAGAGVGFIKRQPPILLSIATGVNCGIAGFVFFGTREYVFTPLLNTHALQAPTLWPNSTSLTNSAKASATKRSDKVFDSALAGAFTGAGLNAYRHGIHRMGSGALAFALLTSTLQYFSNEVSIARVKYVSQHLSPGQVDPVNSPQPVTVDGLFTKPTSSSTHSDPSNYSKAIMDVMTWVAPVKKMTEQEYADVMRKQKEQIDNRLREVTEEIERANKAKHISPDSPV